MKNYWLDKKDEKKKESAKKIVEYLRRKRRVKRGVT
jgi:hypothetical protein